MLRVNSLFYSIQGEGPFAGRPAVFIRLAGCNLGKTICTFCDTEYDNFIEMTESEILTRVFSLAKDKDPLIVITGGEPFTQNIFNLVNTLRDLFEYIQIETNGTILIPKAIAEICTIVCSPKPGTVIRQGFPYIHAVKMLVKHGQRFSPFIEFEADPEIGDDAVYIQPIDEKDPVINQKNIEWAAKICMDYGYNLSLQLHKIANLE